MVNGLRLTTETAIPLQLSQNELLNVQAVVYRSQLERV